MPSLISSFPRRRESSGMQLKIANFTGLQTSGGAGVTEDGDSLFKRLSINTDGNTISEHDPRGRKLLSASGL